MKKTPLVLIFFVHILCCTISAFAQPPPATLTGIVYDQAGGLITGATVTATNKTTNLSRTATTDEECVYVFSNLPVGEYEVVIRANGFPAQYKYPNISLNVGQTVNLKTKLLASAPELTVEITDSPAVETQTSKVDAVIKDKEIENLPLNCRNFLELALLTPGNALAPNFDPTKTNTIVISSAGQIGRGGNVKIDGTDNNDDVVCG